MRIIRGYVKYVDLINEWLAKSFAWLIVALVLGMVYSTLMRYAFHRAPLWTYDFTYMAYAVFFMMGAAYTLRLRGHVRVDVIYRFLSPRGQALLDMFFSLLCFFPLFFMLIYFSMDNVIFSWQVKERAVESILRAPIYPLKTVIPLVSLMLLLQGVAEFIRDLYTVINRGRPEWK
ncbi:MAG TPA: TRAP transporter small permease subunit [Dehalococcoidia bacterium]|nr:TRAP transporter small permease subunit [Dehalococcoidia bacterium]